MKYVIIVKGADCDYNGVGHPFTRTCVVDENDTIVSAIKKALMRNSGNEDELSSVELQICEAIDKES